MARLAAVLVVAAWTCLIPVSAQTVNTQDFVVDAESLLAEGVSERFGGNAPALCFTPEGLQGVCGSILTCPAYQPLLDHLHNTSVLNSLRQRVCEIVSGKVKLCCPPTPPPTTTQSPSLFVLTLGNAPRGAGRPQRPNSRQPSLTELADSDDEDDTRETHSTFPLRPIIRPTSQPSPPITFPRPQQPPQLPRPLATPPPRPRPPPPTTTTTTVRPFTGVDREPAAIAPFPPTTLGPNAQPEPLTEPPEPQVLPAEGECGATPLGKEGTTPWVVGVGSIKERGFHVTCGGALVSRLHVIAAANCLQDPSVGHVRLGDVQGRLQQEDVPLATWTTPNYNPNTGENDLALLTLARPVTFTDNIRPACLPFRYRFDGFRGQGLQVVGWGGAQSLEAGLVKVLGPGKCRDAYTANNLISSPTSSSFTSVVSPRASFSPVVDRRNLCGSQAASASSTTCLSDFGAPLFFHDEDTTGLHFLVGVSSVGDACRSAPGLYTRVGAFIPWLSQQLSAATSPEQASTSSRRLQFLGQHSG